MRWQPRDWRGRFYRALQVVQVPRPPMVYRLCRRCIDINQLITELRKHREFTFLPNGKVALTDWYSDRPGFIRKRAGRSSPPGCSSPCPGQ